jgi:hypothetical protein
MYCFPDGPGYELLLVKAFLALWLEGYSERDLPAEWRAQVAVWAADGITKRDLESYFASWASKHRLETPTGLWRYLQVCCFSKTHPNARTSWRVSRVDEAAAYREGNSINDASWLNRGPGGWA